MCVWVVVGDVLVLKVSQVLFRLEAGSGLIFECQRRALMGVPVRLFIRAKGVVSSFASGDLTVTRRVGRAVSFACRLLASLVRRAIRNVIDRYRFIVKVTPLRGLVRVAGSLGHDVATRLTADLDNGGMRLKRAGCRVIAFRQYDLRIHPSRFMRPPCHFPHVFVLLRRLPTRVSKVDRRLLHVFLDSGPLLVTVPVRWVSP